MKTGKNRRRSPALKRANSKDPQALEGEKCGEKSARKVEEASTANTADTVLANLRRL